jgi:hypothetical protein
MTFHPLTVDDVVRARERDGAPIRTVGGYFQTRCPAHPDRRPSLIFGEGTDGTAFIRCLAGCSTGDVVRALDATGTGRPLDPEEIERRRAERDADRLDREALAREIHERALLHPDRECAIGAISPRLKWDADDLLARGVGWTGSRVTFPNEDIDGLVVGCDMYAAPGTRARELVCDDNPKLRARGTRGLWPATEPGSELMFLVEGAPAAATVLGCGLAAVAFPSASGLRRVDAERLRGATNLVILADGDAPGRRAAKTSTLVLRDVGVRAIALDLFMTSDGRDVADELRVRDDGVDWLLSEVSPFIDEEVLAIGG